MEKKIVSGLMLTLLLIGMLTLAFNVEIAKANQKAQLSLGTDKDAYILGENVTIILTNADDEITS